MQIRREVIKHLSHELWNRSFLGQLAREGAGLGDGGDLTCEEEPEHCFGQHFGAGGAFGELGLAIFDCFAVKADAFVCIKDGTFPDHGLQTSDGIHEYVGNENRAG